MELKHCRYDEVMELRNELLDLDDMELTLKHLINNIVKRIEILEEESFMTYKKTFEERIRHGE